MKRFLLFIVFVTLIFSIRAENRMSGWKFYPSYSSTDLIEESADKVYAVANGSLFTYGKEDQSIKQYFKGQDLNDNNISHIRYNKETASLLIVYKNSNIDILDCSSVKNIPYLSTNTNLKDKTVNHILLQGKLAYLSTAFGVVVIDMEEKEIKETYNLGLNITSAAIANEFIYLSTTNLEEVPNSVLYAPLKKNLIDRNNWQKFPTSIAPRSIVSTIINFQNELIFFIKSRGIFYVRGDKAKLLLNDRKIKKIRMAGNKLVGIAPDYLFLYTDLNKREEIRDFSIMDISTYQTDRYWIAGGDKGVSCIKRKGENNFELQKESIVLDGPKMNSPYQILCQNNKVYVIPGGISMTTPDRFNHDGLIMVYDYKRWSNIDWKSVDRKFGIHPRDYTSIAVKVDEQGDEHIYTTSQGDGVIHYINGEPADVYDDRNSPIENALSTDKRFYNANGLVFDQEGNLWMSNAEANNAVKILDPNGKWHSLAISSLSHLYNVDDIFITSYGDKWINVPRPANQARLVILSQPGNSLDEADEYFYKTFIDTDGNEVSPQVFSSVAEDKDRNVWLGTDKGAIYFTTPQAMTTENKGDVRCNRIKLMNEETGTPYYFLDNALVTTITIDDANQKWIGTQREGVFVLSSDNRSIIHQMNTSNSPLPSDNIYDIAINHQTGEVFIGTDQGLVSYQGEAIEGQKDYSNVYAYPNPVRPEHNDKVTITGLIDHSRVKITDLNGNLIFQTRSFGGQVIWNCRNNRGKKVATGVYLVFSATENAKESVVTKIAIIR